VVENGEVELPPPLLFIFILLFIVPSQGFRHGGSFLPQRPCHRPGGTPGPSPLPPCP
jgi:hypothetical protein